MAIGEFVQASAGQCSRLFDAAGKGERPVVLGGLRAGELLSEERMGRAHDACGMLLVQLMGRGRGSVAPPRLTALPPPSHPIPSHLSGTESQGCEWNNKSASVQ